MQPRDIHTVRLTIAVQQITYAASLAFLRDHLFGIVGMPPQWGRCYTGLQAHIAVVAYIV